jgi:ribonuclease P protein component
MLARDFSLTSQSQYRDVKEKGRRFHSHNFSLGVFNRNDEENIKFGFIMPTKVFPKATDRNRIKRMLSEATRFKIVYLKKGYSCVFLPKPTILRAYAADLIKEVEELFQKARIMKTE